MMGGALAVFLNAYSLGRDNQRHPQPPDALEALVPMSRKLFLEPENAGALHGGKTSSNWYQIWSAVSTSYWTAALLEEYSVVSQECVSHPGLIPKYI